MNVFSLKEGDKKLANGAFHREVSKKITKVNISPTFFSELKIAI
jgi:hypothetical protein